MSHMNLTILPPTLHFLQLPKSQLWLAMPAITNMLLTQGKHKGLFLNYTETLDEVSFLVDAKSFSSLLGLLPASLSGWSVSPGSFRAISVSEGEATNMTSFNVTTGLVASLSAVLAANQVSIFYVSTFETDFVVIKQSQVGLATAVLKQKFGESSVEVEDAEGEEEENEQGLDGEGEPGEGEVEGQPSPSAAASASSAPAAAPAVLDPNAAVYLPGPTLAAQAAAIAASVASANSSLSASSSSAALADAKSVPFTSALQLYALPQTFFLAHWREEEVVTHIRSLLQIFFFPLRASASASSASSASSKFASTRFFSYSNIDSAVSMQVDGASLALLQTDHGLSMNFERWRAFQVAGEFGFEECGIVAALSGPLTRASICPYYISSFFTDVCFVQESKWDHARSILEKEFKFVEREVKQKSQPAAAAAASAAASATGGTAHGGPAHSTSYPEHSQHQQQQNPYAMNLSTNDLVDSTSGMQTTDGVMHMPINFPQHHTSPAPHYPMTFGMTGAHAHPGQAVQSLALMRGISSNSNHSSTASPAHTRGPSTLHSPAGGAPIDRYAPLGASSDVASMPILSAGGHAYSGGGSGSSAHGATPSPYDAMGDTQVAGGSSTNVSQPPLLPVRTTSTGSNAAEPSPYDAVGASGGALSMMPAGMSGVPMLKTHSSSYTTFSADHPSPYDAVHGAAPAQAVSPQHHAAAAPSPYATIGSSEAQASPLMHFAPQSAVSPPVSAAISPSAAAASLTPVAVAAPAKPAAAFSLFASAALVMPSGAAPSAPAAAAAVPAASAGSAFTVEALGSVPVERLSCYRASVDKHQCIQLLRLGEVPPTSPAAATGGLYGAAVDASSPASPSSSSVAGEGLFLLRPCSDPSELLPHGQLNPNLFVLAYNKKGQMIKSKLYRLMQSTPPQQTTVWSLGASGHRLFPSLHAIIAAVVGAHAKPIA